MPQTVTKYSFLLHICDSAFFFNIHYLSHFDYVLLCCIFSVWLIALSILSSKSIHFAANGDEQLSGWTTDILQNTSQSQSCTKKEKKKGHGHCFTVSWSAAGLIHYSFWILVKPFHLRSMLCKLIRHTENCNACSQNWSTERAQFFSTTMPNHRLYNQHFKS